MCLTGKSVDPLVIARTLFCDFIDWHIINNNAVEQALERCAEGRLLSTTSVQVWSNGITLTLEGAKLGLCPNGTIVMCPRCGRQAKYHKKKLDGRTLVFRCKDKEVHEGVRFWDVPLIQVDDRTKVVEGKCRYIIRSSEPFFV